jgi:hypothetical protein
MANSPTRTQPQKSAAKNDGYKYAIVEKIPENWGLGDPVADAQERGFKIVEGEDGPRKVVMRMPLEQFNKMETKVREEAESRLRSGDGLGKVKEKEATREELADSLPDVNDLDG